MSAKPVPLEGRIRQYWDELSLHEQRLAEVLLAAPGQLAMNTATELAQSAGVSKATATRFFRHLGYESYEAARRQAREMQNSGSPLYLHSGVSASPLDSLMQQHLEKEIANLVNTFRSLDGETLQACVEAIAQARRVVVLGWRHSQTIAALIYRNLLHVHPSVTLLPRAGDSLAEQLATLGPQDMAICVGLRRRMPALDTAMAALSVQQVPMLYLSDALAGKPARHACWTLRCHTDSTLIFDSTVALSGVCNLLCSLVARHSGKAGSERLAAIEVLHQQLDELE
ncbi:MULTISPECIES: MurR/RpiR family transcriptional regulator [Pantoea]|jgi:DNA-binding MurR/RpiR family transcriptional regulator|uniref:MurR/RpiR family transcriptional regulator n=1 Tax=Pantoea TaxID=53335 RepID=UPI0015FBA650|nr:MULTISPECIES: MurR/RpiR family transcriptional regulator [Pantoea]MDJ0475592.1 MurR/RpiR family transcriptional regulator [Pantoea eucalypti]QXG55202.1 MurR/RpiR family transcriptional regulator [Pantoea jilinensis]